MSIVKKYFLKSHSPFIFLMLVVMGSLLAPISNAEQPCPNATDEQNPIGDQRTSGTFALSHLACEEAPPEFYIQDFRALRSIDNDVRQEFCSQFESNTGVDNNSGVCNSQRLFNFVEHSERVNEFIQMMAPTLEQHVQLSSAISESSPNPNHIRALMYLCTHFKIGQLARILSSDATLEEKTRALEVMAHNGILGHYLGTPDGERLITNSSLPLGFRTNAIKLFINSPNSSEDRILNYINMYNRGKDKDLQGPRKEYITVLGQAFNEYLELEPSQQNARTLTLLSSNGYEGAEAAVNRFVSASNPPPQEQAPIPESGDLGPEPTTHALVERRVPNLEATNHVPNCSEQEQLTAGQQIELIGPLNTYLASKAAQENSNLPQARESINTWSWYGDIFRNESFWPEIELYLSSRSTIDRPLLQYGRSFYCFITKTLNDYQTLQEQRIAGSVSPELANQIFNEIHQVGANDFFASMIGSLAPYLSEENKLLAIQTIDQQIGIGSGDEVRARRYWRHNTLKGIINTHRGPDNSPVVLAAISALGNNGGILEEGTLTDLFLRFQDPAVRSHIISQYDDTNLINSAYRRLNILQAITSLPNEREKNRYLAQLYGALQSVNIGSGQQYRDRATDTNVVSTETYSNVINQIRIITTDTVLQDSLAQEISRLRQFSEGRDDLKPDNTVAPIADTQTTPNGFSGSGGGSAGINLQGGKPTSASLDGYRRTNLERRFNKPNVINSGNSSNFIAGYDSLTQRLEGKDSYQTGELLKREIRDINEVAGEQAGEETNNPVANNRPTNSPPANNQFISALGNAFNNARPKAVANSNFIPPVAPVNNGTTAAATIASGTSSTAASKNSGKSAAERLREFENSQANSESDSPRRNRRNAGDDELIREIRQITEDTTRLKDRIDSLDIPSAPPSVAANNNNTGDSADQIGADTFTQNNDGSFNSGNNSNIGRASRGPASIDNAAPQAANNNAGINGDNDPNGVASAALPNQSLLSPYSDPSKEDLSKVIVVRSEEEKTLLRNYMAAKENLTCPELRFVQEFYEKHVDNFILSKRRIPWREYALLELDGMNFRFNYPGAIKMRSDIKETCDSLTKAPEATIGQSNRAPASAEEVELVPEEAMPAQEEQGIIKKFMLKLGL